MVSHDEVPGGFAVLVLTLIVNELPGEKDMVPVGVIMY